MMACPLSGEHCTAPRSLVHGENVRYFKRCHRLTVNGAGTDVASLPPT